MHAARLPVEAAKIQAPTAYTASACHCAGSRLCDVLQMNIELPYRGAGAHCHSSCPAKIKGAGFRAAQPTTCPCTPAAAKLGLIPQATRTQETRHRHMAHMHDSGRMHAHGLHHHHALPSLPAMRGVCGHTHNAHALQDVSASQKNRPRPQRRSSMLNRRLRGTPCL